MDWIYKDRFTSVRGFSNLNARLFASWTTANWVCVWRIMLSVLLLGAFLYGKILIGAIIFALTTYMDFLDGAIARYQDEKQKRQMLTPEAERKLSFIDQLNLKGSSHLGASFDPLADKICNQLAIFALGWNLLPNRMLIMSFLLATALTGVRPLKRWLGRGDGRANKFGKIKMWTEVALISLLLFKPDGSSSNIYYSSGLLIIFTACLALAGLSLIFHLLQPKNPLEG